MEPLRSRHDLTYAMEGTAGRALLPRRRLTASIHESFLLMGRGLDMIWAALDRLCVLNLGINGSTWVRYISPL